MRCASNIFKPSAAVIAYEPERRARSQCQKACGWGVLRFILRNSALRRSKCGILADTSAARRAARISEYGASVCPVTEHGVNPAPRGRRTSRRARPPDEDASQANSAMRTDHVPGCWWAFPAALAFKLAKALGQGHQAA